MKPSPLVRAFLLSRPLALAALLAAPLAHAQSTLTWDANGTTALQTDGLGAWLTANQWWNGSANTTWTSGDNAIFGNGGAGGAVTLGGLTTVGSLTFNYFTGTYTLGTAGAGNTITLNSGITKNAGSGIVTISSPLTLGAAQTWTNHSSTNLTPQAGINNGGFLLTIDGGGSTVMNTTANVISGSGGLTKTGSGLLILGGAGTNPVHTYTGTTTISGGTLMVYNIGTTGVPSGNLTINGGVLQDYFGNGGTFTRALGSGNGEVQITGGASGFSGQGATSSTFNIGGAGTTLVWGSTFFNPGTLVLQAANAGVNATGKMSLTNGIDLSGTDRTIASLAATDGGATNGATIAGVVSNSTGTAGITKTGVGNLILTNANTYNGGTTINGGSITLSGSGTINSTNALNLSGGGTLRLVNTAQVNRFAEVAVTVSTGGGITYENTSGTTVYTETLGALAANGGQTNIILSNNQTGTGSQTLTLGTGGSSNLTRSGTASVTFSAGGTGPQASGNKNMISVFGSGTTASGQIIGPWATTGTAANAQTDYAVYNGDFVTPANIAATGEGSWSSTTGNYTMNFGTSSPVTLAATRNINSLRITGGAVLTSVNTTSEVITLTGHTFSNGNTVVFGPNAPGGLTAGTTYFVVGAGTDTFQVSTTSGGAAVNLTSTGTSPAIALTTAPVVTLASGASLGTYGILNGSTFAMTIAPGTGGVVTLPTTSAGQLHVNTGSAGITINAPVNNNTGALTLVKSGSSTLILGAANNTFTGDIAVNAGVLQVGVSGSNVQLNSGSYAGNIFIAAGAALTLQGNAANTLSGVISGDGNLNLNRGTTTLSGANTYTGKTSITLVATNALGSTINVSSFNSVVGGTASSSLGAPTTIANGTIDFGGGGIQQSAQINHTGPAEITDRIINFQFNGNGANRTIDASGGGLLKFTSPSISNGTTGNNVVLQGSSNGEFVHGLPFAFTSLTKSGNGTWTLGGAVGSGTGTGLITVNGGRLALQKRSSLMGGNAANWTAAKIIVNSGGTLALNVGGADELNNTDVTTVLTNLGGLGGAITNNGLRSGSTIGFDTTNAAGGSFTIADSMANSTGTGGGAIGLTKLGTGTLVLTGTATYTGATNVSGGALEVAGGSGALSSTSAVNVTGGTLLLSGSAPNRINNVANFTTTAGTVRLSGGPDFTETVGSLSLGTGSSVIDFGAMSGTNVLTFAASTFSGAGTLQVWNWSGNPATGGGTDQLFFGSTAGGLTGGTSSSVEFFTGSGSGSLGFGTPLANGELVPVPEPSALLATGALGAAALFRRRRPAQASVTR